MFVVLLAFLISYFLGASFFTDNVNLDINIYDTYFIISGFYVLCFFFFLFLFVIYLLRSFMHKFRSFQTFLISIISAGALIIFFTCIHSFIGFTQISFPHSSDNSESSSGGWATNLPEDIMEHSSFWSSFSTLLLLLQIALLFYIIYGAFRYGKNKGASSK